MNCHIAELLWRSGQARPDEPYIVEGAQTLSYGEVWDRVRRLAAHMAEHAEPGGRILMVSGNSIDYIVTYFASLYARQVTVEASPHESTASLRDIAEETSVWAVFSDVPNLAGMLGLPRLNVEAWAETADTSLDAKKQMVATRASDLASIVYTSGTSGRPKGVMLSHGNFRAVSNAVVGYLDLSPADRYLLTLPLYHTYGKSVLLTTTQVGGTLILFADFARLPAFLHTLVDQRVTVFAGVPFHYNLMLRRANLDAYDLSQMKKATVSGAPIGADRVAAFRAALPHVEFFVMYGLTESCTRACYLPPPDLHRKPGSVGIPIEGVRISIRDELDNELPYGTQGEICLAGPNIMTGYYGDADLTAETLRDGWLRTGDLGYLDDEGYLFITDRIKDIIKCVGERISAREIEIVLEDHPNVLEAAVIGMPDPILGERVCAVLVLKEPSDDDSTIREWCNERLSHQRAPRSFRFVDELSRTPSGKIKKHLLKSRFHVDVQKERGE